MSSLYMKPLTSPCVLGNEPTCSVVWEYITFSNFIWKFRNGQLDLGGRKLEFDTRLEIKPKYPTFSWFTEPGYSFSESIHPEI